MSHEDVLAGAIGTTTRQVTVVVERGPVSFFAEAVFDDSAVYRDPRAAQAAGFSSIPVPPTYGMVMGHWGAFDEIQVVTQTMSDGIMELTEPLRQEGALTLHGEQSFHWYRPVLVGDILTGTSTIVDAYAKEAKGHVMYFLVEETLWCDAESGDPVVAARFNVIHRL